MPVRKALPEDGEVKADFVPAGRYASLIYSGGGISGNRALIEWVRAQGMDFGMRFARPLMPALTDELAVLDDDAADARIRRGRIEATFGETQRMRHELVIAGAEH